MLTKKLKLIMILSHVTCIKTCSSLRLHLRWTCKSKTCTSSVFSE